MYIYISQQSARVYSPRSRMQIFCFPSFSPRSLLSKKFATWVFSPKNFSIRLKNFVGLQNTRRKPTKIGVENRAQHASQGHLSFLETDCNPASMPRREYQSSYVCVPPGGPPEGILDIAEYIVCRVVFLLFLFLGPKIFSAKTKIFRRENPFR